MANFYGNNKSKRKHEAYKRLTQYNYIEYQNNNFLSKDYKISAGLDFYIPFQGIFPNPKDYFAIRNDTILENELKNMIYDPLKCVEDFYQIQRVMYNSGDLVQDIKKSIIDNYDICNNLKITQSEILAFRCIFRFINRYDNNGNLIRPSDDVINKLIQYIFNRYQNHIIIATTEKFGNCIHFIISNFINNREVIDEYINYHNNTGKTYNSNYLLFSKNIDTRFTNLQNEVERFLYFK